MSIRCWDELVKYGVLDLLKREYGDRLQVHPEPDYNISLEYGIESIPPPGGLFFPVLHGPRPISDLFPDERDDLIRSASLLKRNALAAPFEKAFNTQATLEAAGSTELPGDLMEIHYRDEEAIYVQAAHDRVTVIFSTIFKDETDKTFGKVFLQVSERDALALMSPLNQIRYRNSLTREGYQHYKTPLKFSTLLEIPHSKSGTSPV